MSHTPRKPLADQLLTDIDSEYHARLKIAQQKCHSALAEQRALTEQMHDNSRKSFTYSEEKDLLNKLEVLSKRFDDILEIWTSLSQVCSEVVNYLGSNDDLVGYLPKLHPEILHEYETSKISSLYLMRIEIVLSGWGHFNNSHTIAGHDKDLLRPTADVLTKLLTKCTEVSGWVDRLSEALSYVKTQQAKRRQNRSLISRTNLHHLRAKLVNRLTNLSISRSHDKRNPEWFHHHTCELSKYILGVDEVATQQQSPGQFNLWLHDLVIGSSVLCIVVDNYLRKTIPVPANTKRKRDGALEQSNKHPKLVHSQ